MNCRNTFIPSEIQCFWCNGQMKIGMDISGTLSCVTYFCKQCGGVSHFAVNDKIKIKSIEVKYKMSEEETQSTEEYICGITGLPCCGCSACCEHRKEK